MLPLPVFVFSNGKLMSKKAENLRELTVIMPYTFLVVKQIEGEPLLSLKKSPNDKCV